jgi:Zn-dependent protease
MELIFFTLVILIFSIVVHEVAHGYAAYVLGDPTAKYQGRLTLNPLSHIDPVGSVLVPGLLVITGAGFLFGWAKPVPYNPFNLRNQRWGEAIVASAGGLTNLFIAIVFAFVVRLAAGGVLPETFIPLATTIVFVNLFLGLFNLIPLPPLDGWTVLRSLVPYRFGLSLRSLEEKVQALGPAALLIFIALFLFILATPFFVLVTSIFTLLTGTAL